MDSDQLDSSVNSSPPEGIQFDLTVDSIRVACSKCLVSDHSIFHCPRIPPNSLIVVEPILPEVFVLEGLLAPEHELNALEVRETIAEACHLLTDRMVLTTNSLIPLNDELPLYTHVQRQSIDLQFPLVIYAVMKKLAAATRRELERNEDLVSSLQAGKRSLAFLSKWKRIRQTRSQLHPIPDEAAPRLPARRIHLCLLNALEEIQSTLPKFTPIPMDEQLLTSVQQWITLLFSSQLHAVSVDTSPKLTNSYVGTQSSLKPAPPYIPTALRGNTGQQLSASAPDFVPFVSRDQPADTTDGTVPVSQVPDKAISDLDKLFSSKTRLTHEKLAHRLTISDAFPTGMRMLNPMMENSLRLIVQSRNPLLLHNGPAQMLLVELARFHLDKARSPEARTIAQHVLIKFQLYRAVTRHGGDTPFRPVEWNRLQQLVATYEMSSPNMDVHRAALHNLVGLPIDVETPPNNYSEVGLMFERFHSMSAFSISLGLIDSGMKRLKEATTALHDAKRLATKLMILKQLRTQGDPRVMGKVVKATCYDEYDEVLDQIKLCNCLPFILRNFLEIRMKMKTVVPPGWLLKICESAEHKCQSAFCFKTLSGFKVSNVELYYIIDLFIHLTEQSRSSSPKELSYINELRILLNRFESISKKLCSAGKNSTALKQPIYTTVRDTKPSRRDQHTASTNRQTQHR